MGEYLLSIIYYLLSIIWPPQAAQPRTSPKKPPRTPRFLRVLRVQTSPAPRIFYASRKVRKVRKAAAPKIFAYFAFSLLSLR